MLVLVEVRRYVLQQDSVRRLFWVNLHLFVRFE